MLIIDEAIDAAGQLWRRPLEMAMAAVPDKYCANANYFAYFLLRENAPVIYFDGWRYSFIK